MHAVSCPRCGCEESRSLWVGQDYLHGIPGDFTVAECEACHLQFQNPRPAPEDLVRLYPNDYSPHTAVSQVALPGTLKKIARMVRTATAGVLFRRTDEILRLLPIGRAEGKLLEIGCASGSRLLGLQRDGWKELFGIEIVPEAARRARELGFSVECGRVEDCLKTYRDDRFDVIITSMVIEHLLNPFEVFEDIERVLKPGGQLLFSTVVRDTLDAREYGRYWGGFDFPRHMVYFSRQDLKEMLRESFEKVEFRHQGAIIDFVRPARWRIQDGNGRFIDRMWLLLGKLPGQRLLNALLGMLRMNCRIFFRCRKKM